MTDLGNAGHLLPLSLGLAGAFAFVFVFVFVVTCIRRGSVMQNPAQQVGATAVVLLAASFTLAAVVGPRTTLASTDATGTDDDWSPATHRFRMRGDEHYIDFAEGSDDNPGSRAAPWKHHPWDRNATGRAAQARGVATYVFKGGVHYRGRLVADDSGTPGRPIRLTADPAWGSGAAHISGAVPVTQWRRCTAQDNPVAAATTMAAAWCADLPEGLAPRTAWFRTAQGYRALTLARSPNRGAETAPDPHRDWNEWQSSLVEVPVYVPNPGVFASDDEVTVAGATRRASATHKVLKVAPDHLVLEWDPLRHGQLRTGSQVSGTQTRARIERIGRGRDMLHRLGDEALAEALAAPLAGAVVWSETVVSARALPGIVTGSDPVAGTITAEIHRPPGRGPQAFDRYYIEDAPQLFDSRGEFYVNPAQRTLMVRLTADASPAVAGVEVGLHESLIDIEGQSHIEIAGLALGFLNEPHPGAHRRGSGSITAAAIQVRNSVTGIAVRNSRFAHAAGGIVAAPGRGGEAQTIDGIAIEGNALSDITGPAILVTNGHNDFQWRNSGHRVVNVRVNNNRIRRTGARPIGQFGAGSQGHAILVDGAEVVDVCDNRADFVHGAGIKVHTGAPYDRGHVDRPFLRSRIAGNHVSNALLALQDFGAIAAWHGGPTYVYGNRVHDTGGYRHSHYRSGGRGRAFRRNSFGVGIYLDSQYKSYVFDNLIEGFANDVELPRYSAVGINEAMGFLNAIFNNTIANVAVGLHKGMTQHNRCHYLGNVFRDIGYSFIEHEPVEQYVDFPTLAYADNLFHGDVDYFGRLWNRAPAAKTIAGFRSTLAREGSAHHDTGERVDTAPADGAARVQYFVPWALSGVVGEWHFNTLLGDTIPGEHVWMNHEWRRREMAGDIPRNDLQCSGTPDRPLVHGSLEDWTAGALQFDPDTRCRVPARAARRDYKWRDVRSGATGEVSGASRPSTDLAGDRMIIEMVLRTQPATGEASLVSRRDDVGYTLALLPDRSVALRLHHDRGTLETRTTGGLVAGQWQHLLIELDRKRAPQVHIYLDGQLQETASSGTLPGAARLTNEADFVVGAVRGSNGFAGAIDFLRIAQSNLRDAQTTIEELYTWQFAGPHLR